MGIPAKTPTFSPGRLEPDHQSSGIAEVVLVGAGDAGLQEVELPKADGEAGRGFVIEAAAGCPGEAAIGGAARDAAGIDRSVDVGPAEEGMGKGLQRTVTAGANHGSEHVSVEFGVDADAGKGGRAIGTGEVTGDAKVAVQIAAGRSVPSVEIEAVHATDSAAGMKVLVATEYLGLGDLLSDGKGRHNHETTES